MYQATLPRSAFPKNADGLFRMALTGEPATLSAAFAVLRTALGQESQLATTYGARVPTGDANDTWEMFSLNDDIYVVLADCTYRKARSEKVLSESFIELHYTLTGSAVASWPEAPAATSSDLDLVVCHLGAAAEYEITCTPGRRRSAALFVRKDALEPYLDDATPAAGKVRRILNTLAADELHFSRIPLSPEHAKAVNQLIANPYCDQRRLHYVQAKVQELLCASVDLWGEQSNSRIATATLGARDIRQLHAARDLLLRDLADAPTIPELAVAAGINSAKLKRGFRLLFGCTIYECLWHERMNQALALLQAGEGVGDVALAVGYRHTSSFSAAFVRRYGFRPRFARQVNNGNAHSNAAVIVT